MALVYINIGSNLGNRKELINTAVEKISERFGICCLSSYIESDPWGFESENRFLNLGVSFMSELDPLKLLDELQFIEKSICDSSHRDKSGRYIDREIDIDIMAIEGVDFHHSRLTIPHAHLNDREFFLIPFQELKI